MDGKRLMEENPTEKSTGIYYGHIVDSEGEHCWCEPVIEFADPEHQELGRIIIHRDPS